MPRVAAFVVALVIWTSYYGPALRTSLNPERSSSPPTSHRETISSSRTGSPSLCATVSSCTPTSIGRRGTGGIRSSFRRTPYSTERFPTAYDAAVYFAQRGYVYVYQDVRGRHESDGVWEPFRDGERDGYDTIEWAAKQPWSNGKVGMQGGSYLGQNQWRAAQAAPPSLVTIFPMVASTSIYHDWITLERRMAPLVQLRVGTGAYGIAHHAEPGASHRLRACGRFTTIRCSGTCPSIRCSRWWGARRASTTTGWPTPTTTSIGSRYNVEEMFDKIAVPVHTLGGWFDIFSQGTLARLCRDEPEGCDRKCAALAALLIGPWGHGPSQKTGALDFGPEANVDALAIQLRWYDYWLKGIDDGFSAEPPVDPVRDGAQ